MRHYTRFALTALIVMCSVSVGHTIPQLINYQGILTDGGGTPITVATNVEFRIWDMSAAGTELWMETQSVTPNADGLFNVLLGSVNLIPDTALAAATAYLSMKVDTDAELSPRTQLVSVAYAYRPGTVDGASGGTISGDVTIQSDLIVSGKATIGPGHTNTGSFAFVAGETNTASGYSSSIGGGLNNIVSDSFATVGGGSWNRARGRFSVVAGGGGSTDVDSNVAIGDFSTVGGGTGNVASGQNATVAGGRFNRALGDQTTVSGGRTNAAIGFNSTISGGKDNTAIGDHSTIAGGDSNGANGPYSTTSGGKFNYCGDSSATVSGGESNTASGIRSTVGGGSENEASNNNSTVGGGKDNIASGYYSTVGGGSENTASSSRATVSGGTRNTASGIHATVSGGRDNTASGQHSFACGANAKAKHGGAIVIAAIASINSSDSIWSNGAAQMVLRADGHFYLTDAGGSANIPAGRFLNTSTGGYLTTGGTWTNASDANMKENYRPVNAAGLLAKIAALSITEWNYKRDDDAVRHIGPTAQEFYALFGVGNDNKSISTIDPAGIALAAIQELHRRNELLSEQNEDMKTELGELRRLVESIVGDRK